MNPRLCTPVAMHGQTLGFVKGATAALDIQHTTKDLTEARHADPRTTMRYDNSRACTNLDRHPNYILAAYMSSAI